MTTTVSTAAELFERDDTFRNGVIAWVADRRCDLRLVDVLLEWGLESQADCARWAASEIDRRNSEKDLSVHGPYPIEHYGVWYWLSSELWDEESSVHNESNPQRAYVVPRKNLESAVGHHTNKFPSPIAAILWLLDNWRINSSQETQVKRENSERC